MIMGLRRGFSVTVMNSDCEIHPEFDQVGLERDEDFVRFIDWDGVEENRDVPYSLIKLKDVESVRKILKEMGRKQNWNVLNISWYERMLDVIEEKEWWLHIYPGEGKSLETVINKEGCRSTRFER